MGHVFPSEYQAGGKVIRYPAWVGHIFPSEYQAGTKIIQAGGKINVGVGWNTRQVQKLFWQVHKLFWQVIKLIKKEKSSSPDDPASLLFQIL